MMLSCFEYNQKPRNKDVSSFPEIGMHVDISRHGHLRQKADTNWSYGEYSLEACTLPHISDHMCSSI
jgi:hypothetical protein